MPDHQPSTADSSSVNEMVIIDEDDEETARPGRSRIEEFIDGLPEIEIIVIDKNDGVETNPIVLD